MTMKFKKTTDSGVTLIELIIVIAMISILSAAVSPAIGRWLPSYRLKAAARDIQSNLQKARILAIKENTQIDVIFDDSITPGYYYFDTQQNNTWDSGEYRVNFSNYDSRVDFGTGNATSSWSGSALTQADKISFGTRGTASPFGSVYIENMNADVCYAVTTLITGTMKIRRYNGNLPFDVDNWIE